MNRREAIGIMAAACVAGVPAHKNVEFVRGWAVFSDFTGGPVPKVGDRYLGRTDAVVTSVEWHRTKVPTIWQAIVKYEPMRSS